jgi:hypothetical protein
MFIRDGEQLNLNGKNLDDTEVWVKEKIGEISLSKKPYVFKAKMKLVPLIDGDGYQHKDKRHKSIPTETTFINPITKLSETWQYLSHGSGYKKKANGMIDVRRDPGITISTSGLHLDPRKDAEKIFFLMHISASIANGRIYLEDKEKEAKTISDALVLEFEAKNLIMSSSSPISAEVTGDDSLMRQIATSWRVSGSESITYSELKLAIVAALEMSNAEYVVTRRGYGEFIEDARRLGNVEARSLILLAIERNILIFEDNTWSLRTREGGVKFLVSIPPENIAKKDDYVIRFLMNKDNQHFYETVEYLIKDPIAERILGKPLFDKMNKKDLVAYCKSELGYPHKNVFGKKVDDLKKIAVEGKKFVK